MNFVLVHGFNIRDNGLSTTDKFSRPLKREGNSVYEADYGWLGLMGVRLLNRKIARDKICPHVEPGSIGIGHSNGCTLLAYACEMGAPFTTVILINPALDRDYAFPESVKNVLVIYNEHDLAVQVSRLLQFHRWGAQGRYGFTGKDARYTQYSSYKLWGIKGHSTVFHPVVFNNLYNLCMNYLEKTNGRSEY